MGGHATIAGSAEINGNAHIMHNAQLGKKFEEGLTSIDMDKEQLTQ